MSDFLWDDLDEAFAALRLFRRRYWEVILLHIVHPQEERLPPGGAFRFEGLEREGQIDCSPLEIAAQHERRFAAHIEIVEQRRARNRLRDWLILALRTAAEPGLLK